MLLAYTAGIELMIPKTISLRERRRLKARSLRTWPRIFRGLNSPFIVCWLTPTNQTSELKTRSRGWLFGTGKRTERYITTTTRIHPLLRALDTRHSDLEATVTDEDLSFGYERPFHIVEANPVNTLYFKYWTPFVNQLYSSDARKMTAYFRLTRTEIANFEFSDKIYLKDTYWRIISISYDATSEDLVKVELLKVLSDVRDCALIPYDINKANGRIRFRNAAGSIVDQVSPSNSICCTKYGYVYDATNNYCYQPFEQ
jgi:hypothetical protein